MWYYYESTHYIRLCLLRPPYVTLKPIKCLALTNHGICLSNCSLGIWKLVSIGREINGLCNLGIKISPSEYTCASQLRKNFVLKFSYGRYISRILWVYFYLKYRVLARSTTSIFLSSERNGTERNNYCNSLIIRRTTQRLSLPGERLRLKRGGSIVLLEKLKAVPSILLQIDRLK